MQKKMIALALASLAGSLAIAERQPVIVRQSVAPPKMSKSEEKRIRRSLPKQMGRK